MFLVFVVHRVALERYVAKIRACPPEDMWNLKSQKKFDGMVAMAREVMGHSVGLSVNLQRDSRSACFKYYHGVHHLGTFCVILYLS